MSDGFQFKIPLTGERPPFEINLGLGEVLFLLGPNGSGKSSLVSELFGRHASAAKRISAHRQTWFSSNAINMTPRARAQFEGNVRSQDKRPQARYSYSLAEERSNAAVFDLIDAEARSNRTVAELVREGRGVEASVAATVPHPLVILNGLLRAAGLPLKVSIHDRQEVVVARAGGAPYSVAQLSDGERNAFLLAADVLTAPLGTLLLIDEPERHLHRSIASPLLTQLFSQRSDCAFVVSTHELGLPLDNENATTVLLRGCTYQGEAVTGWELDVLDPSAGVDDAMRADLLGARQQVLFVEGVAASLDAPLYSMLFPSASVVPKASFRDVEHAVKGLRSAASLHWAAAWGVVDRDQRSDADVDALKEVGIYVVDGYSVESLYYGLDVLRRVASRMATSTEADPEATVRAARDAALRKVDENRAHLVARLVEHQVRTLMLAAMPKREDLMSTADVNISIDVPKLRGDEERRIADLLGSADFDGLLRRYPVRESGALTEVARSLGFKNRAAYEGAVRKLVEDEPGVRDELRARFGDLHERMSAPPPVEEG